MSGQFQGGLQLFLGLDSKDDIHSWTGAHDLKVSGQFFKDDIHSWTGAHDLKVSGQFQGGLHVFSGFFPKMIFILGLVPMV